jgi:hypothetical protein
MRNVREKRKIEREALKLAKDHYPIIYGTSKKISGYKLNKLK